MTNNHLILLVPRAGIEPAQPQGPRDFKSLNCAFTTFHNISGNAYIPLTFAIFSTILVSR